jgi:hypothetical protein
MKVGDLLIEEREIAENFMRSVGQVFTIPPTSPSAWREMNP